MIDVPNKELKLKPGMTANVTVEIARADDVLRVPNAALRFRPTRRCSAVANAGRRMRRRRTSAQTDAAPAARQRRNGDGAGAPRERANGERGGRVWVLSDGQLQPVRVRTGISDGTTTAIVDGELTETRRS